MAPAVVQTGNAEGRAAGKQEDDIGIGLANFFRSGPAGPGKLQMGPVQALGLGNFVQTDAQENHFRLLCQLHRRLDKVRLGLGVRTGVAGAQPSRSTPGPSNHPANWKAVWGSPYWNRHPDTGDLRRNPQSGPHFCEFPGAECRRSPAGRWTRRRTSGQRHDGPPGQIPWVLSPGRRWWTGPPAAAPPAGHPARIQKHGPPRTA